MAEDVTLRLRMLDEFSATTGKMSSELKKLEGDSVSYKEKVGSALDSLKENWLGISAAIAATTVVMSKAFEQIERYAGFAEVKEQLNQMAGQFNTTGTAIVQAMKQVTDGQFSIEQATKSAATALKNSLTPEQIMGLAKAAAAFNDIAGVSVPDAFDRLANAVQLGSAKAAASIVGKGGLGDAMKDLEKGVDDAGKSGELYDAIMKKVDAQTLLTAGSTQTLGDRIDATKASMSDITLKFSEHLTKAALPLAQAVLLVAEVYEKLWGVLNLLSAQSNKLFGRSEAAEYYQEQADAAFRMAEQSEKLRNEIGELSKTLGKADEVIAGNIKKLDAQAVALAGGASAIDAASAKWKLIGGTWTKVVEEAGAVTTGLRKIATAADSIPKDINIKVTTTYVDVRTGKAPSGAEEGGSGSAPTIGARGEPSYGNWGGSYGN